MPLTPTLIKGSVAVFSTVLLQVSLNDIVNAEMLITALLGVALYFLKDQHGLLKDVRKQMGEIQQVLAQSAVRYENLEHRVKNVEHRNEKLETRLYELEKLLPLAVGK